METYTLECGLRIIASPSPTDVAYCGIAVAAGTRDELPHESGMAHFTEHMTFKGTSKRRAWHIQNRIERVGGDLNAFTSKEETIYYCTFMKEHYARAIDLLVNIAMDSTYPAHEMEKEVEVVLDEIESYQDSPAELIYDEFEEILFDGHPLGRKVLGEPERLKQLRQTDMLDFVNRMYKPQNMVLYVYGNIPMEAIVREVRWSLAWRRPRETDTALVPRTAPALPRWWNSSEEERTFIRKRDTHQAHVMMGTRGVGLRDERYLALYLLNNLLGGPGMSSRLNVALREHHGLVYTVESGLTPYTDTGTWYVYFGCDAKDVNRCLKLVHRELARLTEAPLPASTLAAAKRQLIGQICVSYDSFENVAIGMGKRFLNFGTLLNREALCKSIEALTADDIHQVARQFFQEEHLMTLIYSPGNEKAD